MSLLVLKILNVLVKVKIERLTFLGFRALFDLAWYVNCCEREKISGVIIEVGSALGGSSLVIASAKRQNRSFLIYDTFEGMPSPTEMDGDDAHARYEIITTGKAKGLGKQQYYGYQSNQIKKFMERFMDFGFSIEENNIKLIKGLVEETLKVDEPVALAHIDCDWYSPVKVSIERIVPFLSTGGRLIIDDYYHWSGAKKAVDEFLMGHPEFKIEHHSRLHLVKKQL